MEYIVIVVVCVLLFAGFMAKGYYDEKKYFRKVKEKLKNEFGNVPNRKYSADEMINIKKHFLRNATADSVDDITASDLDLDDIYKRVNYSQSSMGDSYLYTLLRNPCDDPDIRSKRDAKTDYFMKNPDITADLRYLFFRIGKISNKASFFDCLDLFDTIDTRRCLKEYAAIVLVIASIAFIFFVPPLGVLMLVGLFIYNIVTYFSERGKIEPYVLTFAYIYNFIDRASLLKNNDIEILNEEILKIKELTDKLRPFTKRARSVINRSSNTGAGNPLDMLADYGRMLFHIDIIRFYGMLDFVKENIDVIEELYEILGITESYLNIALYRASLKEWCRPVITDETDKMSGNGSRKTTLTINDAYHPLIEDPVKNSISASKGVLLTGSNASGKSTFLKTTAINVLMAETLCTCLASYYKGQFYALFSSMSLKDNLEGDSYFMAELKAIKRILNYSRENPDKNIICFVDEVLRGTNTVERISSSTEILKYFGSEGLLCFAATHDGELTFLLENEYDNYHFEEEILDDDVRFNYRLLPGRATSRNAIKLLSVMGFDPEIVQKALGRALKFAESGVWT